MSDNNIFDSVSPDAPMIVNDQGGKQSHNPLRFDLIPAKELAEIALILGKGAEKYGENNWQLIPTNDHLSHALSHIYAYLAGDRSDNHLGNAACRLLFAMWCKNNPDDDTPVEQIKASLRTALEESARGECIPLADLDLGDAND